jgi:hypothetical protein
LAPASLAADLPTDFDANSKYRLDFSDLNAVLRGSVLDMGPSTHKRARKPKKGTASRVTVGNPMPSRLEGNRVMFDKYEDAQIGFLANMRDDLLAVPAQVPIERLDRDEQLAYWFNLHNSIVLAKIAEEYPITRLGSLFDEEDPDAFYRQQKFDMSGTMISLHDIQDHVISNWDNPLVIYGFYMGAVGTPNVQTTAYTGNTVYKQLNDNAVDFVNSVRGTQVWKKKELRVATYYQRMAKQFPNFEQDIITHIRKYAKKAFLNSMAGVEKVSARIEDWHIADLYNGHLGNSGGSAVSNTRDALGLQIVSALPDHVVELLRYRDEKNAKMKREGNVEIEEYAGNGK